MAKAKALSLAAWLKRYDARCVGLRYDPDTKRHVVTVQIEREIPKDVLVSPEDEDAHSGNATRKHLLFPFAEPEA
jgi:hypothetical protein